MNYRIILTAIAFVFFSSITLSAEIVPASPFCDHMVIQRNRSVPVWGTATPGEKVTVKFNNQQHSAVTLADGQWKIIISPMQAGGPYKMEIFGESKIKLKDIYVGEVWLCSGQSNMDMTVAQGDRYWCGVYNEDEEVATAKYPMIRLFDTDFTPMDEIQTSVKGKWEVCSPKTVGKFSASAYFFARELYKKYKVPIGLITTAYGASTVEAWTSRKALSSDSTFAFLLDNYSKLCDDYDSGKLTKKYKEKLTAWRADSAKAVSDGNKPGRKPKPPKNPHKDRHSPCVLYNGMVAPLVPYAIRGAIWYQGESNYSTAKIYNRQMEAMINDWRSDWGQGDFPFIYVQLANHKKLITEPVKEDPMVWVREAQLKNLCLRNTGMVVAIDNANTDNPGNIHPKNKQEIGRRLALVAEAIVYGEDIVYSGPLFDYMLVDGAKAILHFKHTGSGLITKDSDKLTGFAVAANDGTFYHADATIEGNTIVVSAPKVSKIASVRYAWAKNPRANLYNKEGLPASPFRTDNLPLKKQK